MDHFRVKFTLKILVYDKYTAFFRAKLRGKFHHHFVFRKRSNVQELWDLLKAKGIDVYYALEAKNLSVKGDDNPFLGRILGKKVSNTPGQV